ncbi:MAG TPA: tetratricopeptide repeat protein [Polyangia bacterium]|nr:tetratricopeptide repeat protein [Polyangia bacterium]
MLASPSPPPSPAAAQPARQPFMIAAFVNKSGQRNLDFMQGGLPALIAERLEMAPALRFVGRSAMIERGSIDDALSRAAVAGARWVVSGQFEKRHDWKIAVSVEIYDVSAPSVIAGTSRAPAGRGQAVGNKEEVARTALRAALEALDSAEVTPAPSDAQRAAIVAPFARDPYAFVLYGRGVSAYVGIDGYGASVDRAERNLVRALVIDPKVPEIRRYLGLLQLGAGRPGNARALWSYAVELRPTYTLALSGLAALDRTAGLPSARERYARVLELAPDDLDARRAYGELLSDAGALPEAEAQLQAVVKARPADVRARRALALVLASQQAGPALADELAEVVRLDPEDIDARFELAAAYNGPGVGKADLAVATYEEILRRRPRHPVALKLLGDLLRRRGEGERAAGYYERLRRLSPQDPRPLFLLGTAYVEAGKLGAAERMFTEAARFPGMLGDAYANLGAIAYKRGQVKEALWFLSRAAKRRPGKPGVRFNYALALEAAARHGDALAELEAATATAPDDAELWFFSGVVALRMGKTQDAEAHFRQAVRVEPGHEKARHNLALLESLRSPGAEGSFTLVK